jgi:hypothetical protein
MHHFYINIKTKNGTITGTALRYGKTEKEAKNKIYTFYRKILRGMIKSKIETIEK